MTLECQNAKKQRVESIKSATGQQWDIANLNINLTDFMSGTAEVTGRTLKMVGYFPDAVGKAGMEMMKGTGKLVVGTGKMATDVVVGTGKLGYDVVVGTGRVASDVVVGTGRVGYDVVKGTGRVGYDVVKGTGKVVVSTGKVATDVVVGTGRVATDVVVGTGNMMIRGTEEVARGTGRVVVGTGNVIVGTMKGTGRAARRITSIFSQGELIKGSDLKEGKQHLKHVQQPNANKNNLSPTRGDKSSRSRARRYTEMPKTRKNASLSPKREKETRRVPRDEDDVIDELTGMERFMNHLQGMDPEQVKHVLST